MPEHRPAPDAPDRAVDAVIDRILENLASPPDPDFLNRVRAEFRRRVPFHLRSYAAAALILETAGHGGKGPKRGGQKRQEEPRSNGRGDEKRRGPEKQQPGRRPAPVPESKPEENRPRYSGEGTTVFFGMGKRQRLYPRVLLHILCEEGGLASEEIGDIRSFDNYSFADVAPEKAEALIARLDGVEFRGRGIPVSKARKRGEAPEEPSGASAEKRPDSPKENREAGLGVSARYDEEPSSTPNDSSFDDEPTHDEPLDDEPIDDEDLDGEDETNESGDPEKEPKN
jgi:hypothetical protein